MWGILRTFCERRPVSLLGRRRQEMYGEYGKSPRIFQRLNTDRKEESFSYFERVEQLFVYKCDKSSLTYNGASVFGGCYFRIMSG